MLEKILFGNLTLSAIPLDNPIIMGAGAGSIGLIAFITIFSLFYFKKWKWLWREWLTTTDHKKIGIMYIIVAFIMLFRGFSDAIMMRLQQALAYGGHLGYLPPEHYDQVFTAHGVVMIFFMAMAFIFGLINLVVPIQIGARDVAFPYLNSLSFWLLVASAILINISLLVGKFAATGWLAYPPLSELQYSPGVGVDYYLWALSISGIGTLIAGINILVTIIKMRCPGMTLMRMPLFTWSILCAMILVVISFPILNMTLVMLFLDRFIGTQFFTSSFGGNPMLYINLIWTWGHPEVYILILPVFGIFSEVIATFSKKTLFGYTAMVWATAAITFLAFTVWVHHFFTMGAGADVNSFFGIATMIISVPTGVKIFNWLATMYRGRIQFTTPMLWTMGFLLTFTLGGMAGVLLAIPGVDFQLHNSLFLVAHFHSMAIGGVAFGLFAGYAYWFPLAFGFKLNECIGKCAFWFWFVGFWVAFGPLYVLGMLDMPRRINHYYTSDNWHIYLVVAAIGAAIILCGIALQVFQLIYSIKHRDETRVHHDPWDARTLEWATSTPAPHYNFAITPTVSGRDPFWAQKQEQLHSATTPPPPHYEDIHMPKSTSIGVVVGVFSGIFGFAMVWDIHWLFIASGIAAIMFILVRTFDFDTDYYVTAAEVEATELKLSGAHK